MRLLRQLMLAAFGLISLPGCCPHSHIVGSPAGVSEVRQGRAYLLLPDTMASIAASISVDIFCTPHDKYFQLRLSPQGKRDTSVQYFLQWGKGCYPFSYDQTLIPVYHDSSGDPSNEGYVVRLRMSDRKVHSNKSWADAAIIIAHGGSRYSRALSKPLDGYMNR